MPLKIEMSINILSYLHVKKDLAYSLSYGVQVLFTSKKLLKIKLIAHLNAKTKTNSGHIGTKGTKFF
jgi:hypothetical protein